MSLLDWASKPERSDAYDNAVEMREADILADLVLVSELVTESAVLHVSREVRVDARTLDDGTTLPARIYRAKNTGRPALVALLAGDYPEFGRLVHEELLREVRERAEQEIADEKDDDA